MKITAVLVVLFTMIGITPAIAAEESDDHSRHLVIDPTFPSQVVRTGRGVSAARTDSQLSSFALRQRLEKLTTTLTATPQLRATDATVGLALIAFGARSRHSMSSAVFVGAQAIRLGIGHSTRAGWRSFDVQPEISRERLAISVRKTFPN